MDVLKKLAWVGAEARFESEGEHPGRSLTREVHQRPGLTQKQLRERYSAYGPKPSINVDGQQIPIYMAAGGGGRSVPLLKAMLTTACERDCNYCAFRAPRTYRRVTLRPDELARAFDRAYRSGWVEGLFLSTGMAGGGVSTQDRLLDTASILREKLGFRGYLHMKIMPGAERDQVQRAMQLANRVSANLEAPGPSRLSCLAPQKQFHTELLQPLNWAAEIRSSTVPERSSWSNGWASTSTQFVVGPAGESDLELMSTVASLFSTMGLRRAYFEAFNPIIDTPFEGMPAERAVRQLRLYQASYLLRDYGFELEDLPFHTNGHLPAGTDPKQAYAELHLEQQPVELNRAPREILLRVPGIGPRAADAVIRCRRERPLRELGQLRRIGIIAERAAPYILLEGHRPAQQMALFAT